MPVHDVANVIPDNQERNLTNKLIKYSDSTSTQILVVTVPSLNGLDKFQYTLKLAQAWGIGDDKKDNGIVIMVAPNDRKAFITTGRGLGHAVTDIDCGRIVDQMMIPKFKENKYYEGIDAAVTTMFGLLTGSFKADQLARNSGGEEIPLSSIFLFVLLVLVFLFVLPRILGSQGQQQGYKRKHRRGQKGYTMDDRGASPFGGTIIIGGGNSWGDFSSGGGDFGGGGGFGGFGGGGDFGGGGAGGSW